MTLPEITQIAVNALENIKGENIIVLDTTSQSCMFNAIIICSGNSPRQVTALAHSVSEDFKANNIKVFGVEGKRGGEWVLVDGGEIIVHIMLPQVRLYYDLETLWNG